MNRVFLIGNITRDPELTETNNGTSLCRFSLAVNRGYSGSDGERQTDFFNITAWRGTAENIAKFCRKGSKVAVSGSIQIRQYEDQQGNKRTATDIIAQEVEFLNRANGDDNASASGSAPKKSARLEAFDDDEDMPF